ncbi:MAG: acetyltransferase [Nannocystaceae bacterium]
MTRIVILGAGGHAREIANVVEACRDDGDPIDMLGFLDDKPETHGCLVMGLPVLGPTEWLYQQNDTDLAVVAGIGDPAARRRAVGRATQAGARFEILVHPTATITPYVSLAPGVVITAGCVLTNNITIGRHTHINRLTTVGHDCRVGSFVHLAPGVVLSGNVTIGDECYIGTKSCVIQGLTIGARTVVGAGAAVVHDIPGGVTAVGVPARIYQKRKAA